MIKAVLLDVDNTLLDFHACAEASMIAALEENRIPNKASLFRSFLKINDGLWREIEQGMLTKDRLHQIRWNQVFADQGIDFDGILFEKSFLKYLAQKIYPIEGAYALLEYLSGKYILCAVTNGPYEQQRKRLKAANMLSFFDHLFVSEKIGFEKPSKSFFDACFAALPGILPEETMIIGDSITADMVGGLQYGIQTCWFNYHHIQPPKDIAFTYIANTLEDIKCFL